MPQVFSSVKAVIKNGHKFLAINQKVKDVVFWDLPGGKVHYGESPQEALIREVREETNLDIEIVGFLGVWWYFRYLDKDQVVCLTFLCQPAFFTSQSRRGQLKNKKVDLSKNPAIENITEFRWLTPKKFLSEEHIIPHQSLSKLIGELKI